jgi:GAF domain-containing protein
VGIGTPPWVSNLEQQGMFLGAESLAGNVVTLCRPGVIQNLDEEHNFTPAARVEYEKSAAIYPILYAGRIAGVLLVSSTQPDYFVSQERTSLVQNYANLLALVFEPEEFYAPDQIALHIMPGTEEQKRFFANFRHLMADTMISPLNYGRPANNIQADLRVWQHLEEELIQYASRKKH